MEESAKTYSRTFELGLSMINFGGFAKVFTSQMSFR